MMHGLCRCVKKNPWKREKLRPIPAMYSAKRPKFTAKEDNVYLDVYTKRAALKASPSVVALISYTGEQVLFQGSGTIIESYNDNTGVVLTSANLIRHPTKKGMMENNVADNLKVVLYLNDGRRYEGKVFVYDFHYNIVAIRFQSDSSLPAAILRQVNDHLNVNLAELSVPDSPLATGRSRQVDDYIDVNLSEKPFHERPHSSHFDLVPGDAIVAVGRYFNNPFDLMAAPGIFSLDRCGYDCKELLKGTCMITRCGEGGPIINLSGEVIGIMFYEFGFTPFLPINIARKWWEHCKRSGEFPRPSLGMEATNLYAADPHFLELLVQKFPSISDGVIVEKVIRGSSAGLCVNDVIVECGGKIVQGFLEFFEMMCDKVGDELELVVVRADHTAPLHLKMMVTEAPLNGWPCRSHGQYSSIYKLKQ